MPSPPRAEVDWPPQLDQPYPDLELINHADQSVRMLDFKGKVIVVEYIGMTCPACQAFSGAHEIEAYGNIVPQRGLEAIKDYFPRYTGLSLEDDRIVFIQMLLYSMSMGTPTPEDAKELGPTLPNGSSQEPSCSGWEGRIVGPGQL